MEGQPLILNYNVKNPHDNFTNLAVRWFRNQNADRAAWSTSEITEILNEYQFMNITASYAKNATDNCTYSLLYNDAFTLNIFNFSSDKNGYYWCQIYVNNSVSQPSQYAWFYAAHSSLCSQQSHFKIASEPQCAEFHPDNNQATATTPEVGSSAATQGNTPTGPQSGMEYLLYIIGFLVAFILFVICSFTLLLLLLYFYKDKRKKINKRDKPVILATSAATDVDDQYDEVATFKDSSVQNERKCCNTSRKQGDTLTTVLEITPLDYETVCLTPNEDKKHKRNIQYSEKFEDDMHSINQSASTGVGEEVQTKQGYTTRSTSEQLYSSIKDKNSLLDILNNEHEYAEPQIVTTVLSNKEGQNTQHVGGHYYHSLEGSDKGMKEVRSTFVDGCGTHKELLHIKHVESVILDHTYDSPDTFQKISNREKVNTRHSNTLSLLSHQNQSLNGLITEENKYHKLTPPSTLPHSNQSLNETGTANAPILCQIEHCQLDDPLYEGVPQHSDTLQESKDMIVDMIFDDPTYA